MEHSTVFMSERICSLKCFNIFGLAWKAGLGHGSHLRHAAVVRVESPGRVALLAWSGSRPFCFGVNLVDLAQFFVAAGLGGCERPVKVDVDLSQVFFTRGGDAFALP